MARNRREVLRAAGAVGLGSIAAVGSVSAQSDGSCAETVSEESFSGPDQPLMYNAALVAVNDATGIREEYTDTFSPDSFADAEFSDRRAIINCRWNQSVPDQGLSIAVVTLQAKFAGVWTDLAQAEGESGAANELQLEVVDGESYGGGGAAVIDEETEYRIRVRHTYNDTPPIVDYELDVEFQAFDSDC